MTAATTGTRATTAFCTTSNDARPLISSTSGVFPSRSTPDSADALNNLGWALGQLGYIGEAKRAFTRALELRPGDVLAQNNLRWASTR
jgi:hypothetical protein